MATRRQQPQLYRTLSAGLFIALGLTYSLATVQADEIATNAPEQGLQQAEQNSALQPVPGSNYTPQQGATFYLLGDSSYGSNEEARIRLEASAREQYNLEPYGGADIRLYRITDPLRFLKGQKNLHRINIEGHYRGEGVANTLSYLWDNWYKSTRRSWQRVLASKSREVATAHAPEFATSKHIDLPTRFEAPTPYAPLTDLPLIASFRYPIWQAKSITPPKGVKLEGSSSDFFAPRPGNVQIPLGKQAPGLYLVEAIIGTHRATTLLFVSNSIVVSKIAGKQLLAWSVDRQSGKPQAGSELVWSDGTGTLQSQQSNDDGIAVFEHQSPEHSYLLAKDAQGGVTISENFYYDSEIYNAKIYAFTDRPLYRPGDKVHVKFVGREFVNARDSKTLGEEKLQVSVIDPSGLTLIREEANWQSNNGAQLDFTLPEQAMAGGYELQFQRGDDNYSAAFRVAEYVKPHFDIQLQMDKPSHKTGEAITGSLQLRYPDGAAVANAHLSLSLRAQKLSMVEGDLGYGALFPVKLQQQELTSDKAGNIRFELPPAKEPSRYIMTLLANDTAAWRVKTSKEILIERGMTPYLVTTAKQFTAPGESVAFDWQPQPGTVNIDSIPSQYELVRLEDRSRQSGNIAAGSHTLDLELSRPGSYTLSLRDTDGNLLAATNHWVSGEGMESAPGTIEIHFDKRSYLAGEEAQALITFPEPTDEALLTLERDQVEQHALLTRDVSWFKAKRQSATQWQITLPVTSAYAPNMTFSVLTARHGEYLFRNAGLKVAQPRVDMAIQTDKPSYRPGEKVEVTIHTSVDKQPVAANLSISVVDEMVYLLQPELAPDIHEFFYHPRRNNVRTSSSLNFITYDMSMPGKGGASTARRFNERGVKVLERPRRDEQDTALWLPSLQSDAKGDARFTFTMPDSLARWRITVRAMTEQGIVGQEKGYTLSDKPFYLKWMSPTRFRVDDKPQIGLVAFNQQEQPQKAKLSIKSDASEQHQEVTLAPGANYLQFPMEKIEGGMVQSELQDTQGTLDTLQTLIDVAPQSWPGPQHLNLVISGASTTLALPADASKIELTLLPAGRSAFLRTMDALIDAPYCSLEQTASRLIPLGMAYSLMASTPEQKQTEQLRTRILNQKLRLVKMAGIDGSFGWWGNQSQGSILLSSYAYYADWSASRALGMELPPGQGDALLGLYQQYAEQAPLLHKVISLWLMEQMGLPIDTLLQGTDAELAKLLESEQPPAASQAVPMSIVMADPQSQEGNELALLFSNAIHLSRKSALPPSLQEQLPKWQASMQANPNPLMQALLYRQQLALPDSGVEKVLSPATLENASMEQALSLALLAPDLKLAPVATTSLQPEGKWRARVQPSGQIVWRWRGNKQPAQLALKNASSGAVEAELSYRSSENSAATLPVRVERTLYRLIPTSDGKGFQAEPRKENEALNANDLYLDEITVTPQEQQTLNYGLLEVPLPPGASVEPSTWGINIANLDGNKEPQSFSRSDYEEGELSYQIPVPELKSPTTYRQLVRFATRGEFTLPPVRLMRLYHTADKALSDDGHNSRWQVQ